MAVKVGNELSAGQRGLWEVVASASFAGFHMLPQTSGTDSTATHKICDHAMLTTSGDRWGHNANRQAFHIHKFIVKEQKIFLELVVAGMDPCVPESGSRGPKKRDGLINAVLVAHRFIITRDRMAVNGCGAIIVSCITDFFSFLPLQVPCQGVRAGSATLARFLLYYQACVGLSRGVGVTLLTW